MCCTSVSDGILRNELFVENVQEAEGVLDSCNHGGRILKLRYKNAARLTNCIPIGTPHRLFVHQPEHLSTLGPKLDLIARLVSHHDDY